MWIDDYCWIWCIVDDRDEWCALDMHMDCEEPPGPYGPEPESEEDDAHESSDGVIGFLKRGRRDAERAAWLWFELDALGNLTEVLGLRADRLDTWLLRHGLAPGQTFLIRARYAAYHDWEGGYEAEVECSVVAAEPWSDDRAAAAWEQLWGRRYLVGEP